MLIMNVIHPVRVKVACIRNPEEAGRAVTFGADAIGMAAETPIGGPGLTQAEILEIVAAVPESVGTFLMTTRRSPVELAELARSAGVNTIQLWDEPDPDAYAHLRSAVPGISIVQSIPVEGEGAIERAIRVSSRVDALLLDSANRTVPVRWEEQHGRTHDWQISRRITEAVSIPVILSGGLTHLNVADAIRAVRPYGVEVCTGVRTKGALNTTLLVQFLEVIGRINP
jgi:phosphoribosylanthranilate isomerase